MKTALKNNFEKTLLVLLPIVMCMYARQTYAQMVNMTPYDSPVPDSLRLAPDGRMAKEQAIYDLNALVYTVSEVHPNMYAVCNQGEFMSRVNAIEQEMPDTLTRATLYKYVAPLLALLGDGHTHVVPPYNDILTKTVLRLPVQVDVDNQSGKITTLYSIYGIPKGAEITEINGVSSSDIVANLLQYVSGERRFFRLMILKNYFSYLFQLCYPSDKYAIKYVWKDKIKETMLKGVTFDEIRAEKKKAEKAAGKTPEVKKQVPKHFEYQLLEGDRVALMSFNDCTDSAGMAAFLDSMITEINAKKVQNLIIDVRKNGGGDSRIGDLIFERISKVPFQQFGKAFMRITPTTQRLLKNAYGNEFLAPTGLYLENEDSLNVPLNDKTRCYNGKVWLLTSNYTFSSAASFSWTFKYFNMGKVVGEETGGMNVCFGDVLEYRLPISQLYCYMSYKRFWQYGADETDIHGTIPDIAVSADKALETTLQLIRNEK